MNRLYSQISGILLMFGLNFGVFGHPSNALISNNYSFTYNGPDTIFVGTDCTGILDWGHPGNPEITPNMPGLQIINQTILISGGFSMGDPVPAGTTVSVTYRIQDNMGGTSEFTFTIYFADITPPEFTMDFPSEVTLSCGDDVDIPTGSVTDNCTPFEELSFEYTDSDTINFCEAYSLMRTWVVTDEYGNSSTFEQTLFIEADTIPPVLVEPAQDLVLSCSNGNLMAAFNNWINTNGGSIVTDNCTNLAWTTIPSHPNIVGNCGAPLEVTFVATDPCGNFVSSSALFSYSDIEAPVIIDPPQSLVHICDGSDITDMVSAWIENAAGTVIQDNCLTQDEVLVTTLYNGMPLNEGNLSQTITALIEGGCDDQVELDGITYDGVLVNLEVSFVFSDYCGNSTTADATFLALDESPPVLTSPAQDLIIDCSEQMDIEQQFLDWVQSAGGATGEDDCGVIRFTTTRNQQALLDDFYLSQDSSCGLTGTINVEFFLSDFCGNMATESTSATFTVIDTIAPVIEIAPIDIVLECTPDLEDILADLIESQLGSVATDPCSEVVWTTFSWEDSNGNEGVAEFGEREDYPFPNADNCTWSVTLTMTVSDACGNTDYASATITIEDNTAPEFETLPEEITVECNAVPEPIEPTVIDNCRFNLSVTMEETSNQGLDSTECAFYEYTIIRTWTAEDACGNVTTSTQTINVTDSTGPSFSLPANNNVDCAADITPDMEVVATQVVDNCSHVTSLTFTEVELIGPCDGNFRIERRWTATDVCGNTGTFIQQFFFTDTEAPEIITPAENLTISCGDEHDPTIVFLDWMNDRGGAEATDNCSTVSFFAAEPGSYDPNNPSTFPGIFPTDPGEGGCGGTYFLDKSVDFVFHDDCGNATVQQVHFIIIDDTPPEIELCLSHLSFINTPGLCSGEAVLSIPVVSEECLYESIADMVEQTLPVTSLAPGDPDVIVNALQFELPVQNSPQNAISAPATLSVFLNMVDAEGATEFFNIYDEENGYIGRTNNVSEQCGSGETTFMLENSSALNRWAADGVIRIRLEPNVPGGQPGRFSINDICPGAEVTLTLDFTRNLATDLIFEYTIDDSDRIPFDPDIAPEMVLPVGVYSINYFIRDCFGNESFCEQEISIIDNEAPQISCPENMTHLLDEESCSWTTTVPLPVSFTDNCALPESILLQSPLDSIDAFLTFAYDPDLNDYLAEDKEFIFSNVSNLVQEEQVRLTITLLGDIDAEGEYFSIFNEDDELLGTTEIGQSHVMAGDCSTPSVITFEIPKESFNQWAQDGIVTFKAVSNVQFPVPPGGPGSGINPCDPDIVQEDGQADSISYMFMQLEAGGLRPIYFVTGATEVPLTQTEGNDLRPEVTFNPGTSLFHYIGNDANGNSDTCVFEVLVMDTLAPVAICQNIIININPSGILDYVLDPDEIDNGSFDNCEIIDREVTPSTFTCNDIGQEFQVMLTVTDISGLTSSCQSIVRVERFQLNPDFELDFCAPDTLRLFSNIPAEPPGSNYTFLWTGPNNFTSNLENPVITGINQSYSGTYHIRIQGFGGCFAEGVITVVVPEVLGTPDITFEDNPVCQDGLIMMETQTFSGNITYHWYRGMAPNGILVASTPAPAHSLTLPPGTYNFYVVAESAFCTSSPSVSRQVRVLSRINAVITNDFLEVCEEDIIQLSTPISGTEITYEWSGPSNFTSSEQNPIVSTSAAFNHAGLYTLRIFEFGCPSIPAQSEVIVKDKPVTPILTSNQLQCPGGELVLSVNNIPDANQYQWQHPDGSVINTTINILYLSNASDALNGDWSVIVVNDGCASDISLDVLVDIEEAFDFSANNSGPICEGDEVTLTATPLPEGMYVWTGPTPNIPEIHNPTFVPSPGIYTVIGTTGKGCIYEGQTTVVVNPRPVVTAISNDAEVCVSGNTDGCFQVSVFPPNDGTYQFEWLGPGFSSNEEFACIENISSSNNGNYSLEVTNSFGCPSTTSSIVISVKDIPSQPIIQPAAFYCEGMDIVFTTADLGDDVEYTWETPIGTINTDQPELRIPNGMSIHNGAYSLSVTIDGCTSSESIPVEIVLRARPARPSITGSALVCEGDTIFLGTTFVPGGTFIWHGPDEFSSQDQNTFVYPATFASEGNYTVRVSVDGCLSASSIPYFVKVNSIPITPGLETAQDILCASADNFNLDLCIVESDVVVGTRYTWYNAVTDELLAGPFTSRCFNITDLDRLEDGINSFYVIASKDGCFSQATTPLEIRIDKLPNQVAQAGTDLIACNQDEVIVGAVSPSIGTGQWIALDNHLGIEMATDPSTSVFGLRSGENFVAWSLNYRSCLDYSRDTIVITLQTQPVARDDSGQVPFAGVAKLEILNNDDVPFAFNVEIIIQPMNGNLIAGEDNSFDFMADPNYVGNDQFVYRICATGCVSLCSEAVVRLEIGDESICDIPTIITPNDDGINDLFFIPCLSSNLYPNNKVAIFNEWGASVFEQQPYLNSWDGTFNGQPLPVGTYFYVVEFGGDRSTETGFLMIKR